MEASSSSDTTNPTFLVESVVDNDSINKIDSSSVGGRKAVDVTIANPDLVEVSSDEWSEELLEEEEMDSEEEEEEVESEEEDSEDDDDEEEEEWNNFVNERKLILEEAKQLKTLVGFYAHPEATVAVDGFAAGRSFFRRPSAVEQDEEEEEEEREQALADALALKKLAVDYAHPERALEMDSTACARNYFSQPWAAEQETFGAAEQRALAIQQAHQMAKATAVYQHPEAPLEVSPAVFGRNYFGRPSAAATDDSQETALVLEEMKALKEAAVMYRHPEAPVEVSSFAFGRNYFQRASAPDQETEDDVDDRETMLEEMKELKNAAFMYRHPEAPLPLEISSMATGRNYFDRPSAEVQDVEEAERQAILREMKALKSLAVTYQHPELPVQVDATAMARNYFTRPSAPTQEAEDVDEEREAILQDMLLMKQQTCFFLHPERPIDVDPTCFARNYYGRPSAIDKESFAAAEERALALAEVAAFKEQAVLYLHPEAPLKTDAAVFGRNYYSRPAADNDESDIEEERERVLEEMASLKKLALDFLRPERPMVNGDPWSYGRNYFGRASAPDQDDEDLEDERDDILEELHELKRLAVDYMHPERPVVCEDPCAFGRNYFGRASATEQEEDEFSDEREIILEEMAELKQGAIDFMCPERPLPAVDPTAFGRSYFERIDSMDSSDDEEERAQVLADATALKKLAVDFAHPELPVVTTDATIFGRSYFSRPSAQTSESLEEAEERAQAIADAQALKKVAVFFAHPEASVATDATACARSYFSRASAADQETVEEAQERAQNLAEAQSLEKLARDYLHPAAPVETTDPTACGRNYFTRASAVGAAEHIHSEGYEIHSERRVDPDDHQEEYGHFDMDEDLFYDMRQSIVLPLAGGYNPSPPKFQSNKIGSDEEGELSRSPSSVMLFTGALEDDAHPPLPTMG